VFGRLSILAVALLALGGCLDAVLSPPDAPVARILVSAPLQLWVGDSAAVHVETLDGRGAPVKPRVVPRLETSDSTILKIRGNRVVAVGSGLGELVAVVGDLRATAEVRVHPRSIRVHAWAVLNQVVQRSDGSVPVVRGRPGLLQVFVLADQANFLAPPPVRVRLFQEEVEVLATELQPTVRGIGIPTLPLPEGEAVAWNLHLPAELVQPGLGVVIEVDPAGQLPHTEAHRPRIFPADGQPYRFRFETLPDLRIRFVPIRFPDGATGPVSEENVDAYLAVTRQVLPVDSIDRDVRATYSTSLARVSPDFAFDLLTELSLLRTAEGSDRYYYGIAPGHPGGWAFLRSNVAFSFDNTPGVISSEVVAHELGHNFGLMHAGPCPNRNDSYRDPNYPYARGTIGVYGYDAGNRRLLGGTEGFDVMGRCAPPVWISDYHYLRALFHLRWFRPPAASGATAAAPQRRQSALLVWGRIDAKRIRLEPVFEVETVPSLPRVAGAYTLEGRAHDGRLLFSHAFEPERLAHGTGEAAFVFAVPLDFPREQLASVRVQGGGRSGEVRPTRLEAGHVVLDGAPGRVEARRSGPGIDLRWDPAGRSAALVIDPRTGQVVGLVREGFASVVSDAPELELRFSDGLPAGARRVTIR
jgi:hypothetical protein